MNVQKLEVDGKQIIIYGNERTEFCLIQPVNEFEMSQLQTIAELIQEQTGSNDFLYVAMRIDDWNAELTPWKSPAAFGDDDFGDGAGQTLDFVLEKLLPELKEKYLSEADNVKYVIGGYSLAGLFALWAGYQTDVFYGVAAASPSVWYPDWDNYMKRHAIKVQRAYLSLGNKEAKTKNVMLATVSERIEQQYKLLTAQLGGTACQLEWNQGNHFRETESRIAKAFAKIIKQ